LAEWIREKREDIYLLQVIHEAAAAYQRHGHSVDRLYCGTQLAEALTWRERFLLSLDEEAFLLDAEALNTVNRLGLPGRTGAGRERCCCQLVGVARKHTATTITRPSS
jgi:hypothetical protein